MNAKTGYKTELPRGVESEWQSVRCVLTKPLLPDTAVHMPSIPRGMASVAPAFITCWLILNKEAERLENTSSPFGFCSCPQDLGNAFLQGVQDEGRKLQADCPSLWGKRCASTTWPVWVWTCPHPKPRVTILPGRYATAEQAAACAPGSWPAARTAQLHHCGEGVWLCPPLNSPSGRFSGLLPSHF